MRVRDSVIAGLAIAAVTLVVSGCSSDDAAGAKDVNIVYAGSTDFSDGASLKFEQNMRERGYVVNVSKIDDSSAALRVLLSGQADFLFTSPSVVVTTNANSDTDLEMVAMTQQRNTYVMLAQNDVTIENMGGLTAGTPGPGTTIDNVMKAVFRKMNLPSVNFVKIGGTSAQVAAILSDQLDLAPSTIAAAIPAMATGKVKELFNIGEELGPYLNQGLVTRGAVVEARADMMQDAAAAMIEANRWASTEMDEYLQLVDGAQASVGLDSQQQEETWRSLVELEFFPVNGGMCDEYVDATMAQLFESDVIAEEAAGSPDEWLNKTFVDAYLEGQGEDPSVC